MGVWFGGKCKFEIGGRIGGIYTSHNRLGICGADKETLSTWGKKGGGVSKQNQSGIHGLSKDQIIQNAKKGGEKSDVS